jgi:hypothetical protein
MPGRRLAAKIRARRLEREVMTQNDVMHDVMHDFMQGGRGPDGGRGGARFSGVGVEGERAGGLFGCGAGALWRLRRRRGPVPLSRGLGLTRVCMLLVHEPSFFFSQAAGSNLEGPLKEYNRRRGIVSSEGASEDGGGGGGGGGGKQQGRGRGGGRVESALVAEGPAAGGRGR